MIRRQCVCVINWLGVQFQCDFCSTTWQFWLSSLDLYFVQLLIELLRSISHVLFWKWKIHSLSALAKPILCSWEINVFATLKIKRSALLVHCIWKKEMLKIGLITISSDSRLPTCSVKIFASEIIFLSDLVLFWCCCC